MADTITLTNLDNSSQAERLMDRFEEATGWEPAESLEDVSAGTGPSADRSVRTYVLPEGETQTDVVEILTGIDEAWTEHITLEES